MEQPTTLVVEIKNVYGNDLLYPICPLSKALCKIAKTKTLNADTIFIIRNVLRWKIRTANQPSQEV